ncbi:MAG TPA: ABC transporter substrate-binding protein [Opitutaceae bacterium]
MFNWKKFLLATGFAAPLTLMTVTAETIRVAIGTQDTTINCAAGGPIVRELKLLEKYLPHEGKYKDVEYNIVWENQPTGAQLNSKYLADQLDIVQMADFPSIVGATAFETANHGVHSIYIASLAGGISGAGNAILVPKNSAVQSLSELKGKRISVPFASTSHAMLIRALQDLGWDPNTDVTIVSQTPEVGGSALRSGQIDAHADFVPFGELFPFRGYARKIYDGSSTGVTTTHGVQVRSDFAAKYPEIVIAYLRATLEANRLYREDPEGLSEKLQQWTGVEAEVYYAFHGPHGIQIRDYSLKPEFINAIKRAQDALTVLKKVQRPVNIETYVNDQYIREAAKAEGLDYDKQLKNYDPLPFVGDAVDTHAPVTDPKRAGQIWVRGEEHVRLYSTAEAALRDAKALKTGGKTIRVVFVHDRNSGLKLFANDAWYVENGSEVSAFLLKKDAEAWTKAHPGSVLSHDEVEAKL